MTDSTLPQLLSLSHDLGREERQLAILGEGNTSAACEDGKTFWVKGSGSSLATISEKQFSRAQFADVLGMLERTTMDEKEIDAALKACLADPLHPKPSIETLLHAICLTDGKAKFVGHTHAEACNQILCSRHGAEPFTKGHIFPDAIVVCGRVPMVVPYADPGLALGIAFRESLRKYLEDVGAPPKLVLMVNHGIVALGQTARDVLNVTLMAQKWARILVGAMQLGGAQYLTEENVRRIDGRSDEEYRRRMLSR